MRSNNKAPEKLKILIVGDLMVGKTSIISTFAANSFHANRPSTIGLDFTTRSIEIEGQPFNLEVWDTAGNERFKTLITAYYRGAAGALIVYDRTNRKTFEHLIGWMHDVDDGAGNDVTKMIIENKNDLDEEEVSLDEARAFASEHGVKMRGVSAKTSENIVESFQELVKDIMEKRNKGKHVEPIEKADRMSLSSRLSRQKKANNSCC